MEINDTHDKPQVRGRQPAADAALLLMQVTPILLSPSVCTVCSDSLSEPGT